MINAVKSKIKRDNKTPKKDIVIIGDSMIKYINGREISRSSSVKIRSHPGATTEDLIDYVRPTARKKTKMMVIYSGTNDITNKVNTLQKIRKVINAIKENEILLTKNFAKIVHPD